MHNIMIWVDKNNGEDSGFLDANFFLENNPYRAKLFSDDAKLRAMCISLSANPVVSRILVLQTLEEFTK